MTGMISHELTSRTLLRAHRGEERWEGTCNIIHSIREMIVSSKNRGAAHGMQIGALQQSETESRRHGKDWYTFDS